ncbi:hypothetical protein ACFOST_12995 [Cytobacillus kochii]|uniref:hypothetical protein n=1 Tax=Cytobacillus kochii TaxID=859143 RepID=UPI0027841E07|nr:hypothetical protein [Cytobacillus kochii]MDQ0185599.1 hypothetical protein [Cytobacillus kochii]
MRAKARYAQKSHREGRGNARKSKIYAQVMREREKECAHIPDTRKSGIEKAEEMRARAKNAYKSKKK